MGYSLFSNSHFEMGVTVMGFAEHFGHTLLKGYISPVIDRKQNLNGFYPRLEKNLNSPLLEKSIAIGLERPPKSQHACALACAVLTNGVSIF